jgi:hypothetical protein
MKCCEYVPCFKDMCTINLNRFIKTTPGAIFQHQRLGWLDSSPPPPKKKSAKLLEKGKN